MKTYYLVIAALIGALYVTQRDMTGRVTDASGNPIADVFVVALVIHDGGGLVHPETTCIKAEITKSTKDGSFTLPIGLLEGASVFFYKKGMTRKSGNGHDSNVILLPSTESPEKRLWFLHVLTEGERCTPITGRNVERFRPLVKLLDEEAMGLGIRGPLEYEPNMFTSGLDRLIRDAPSK